MADRYVIIERTPAPPRQPFYESEAEATAAFLAIRDAHPNPERLALVRVSDAGATRDVDVTTIDGATR